MKRTGIVAKNILLPKTDDYTAWACIACDQFTSEKSFWKNLEREVSGKKTTLDLILPEIYLNDNLDERIDSINKNIDKYLVDGVFETLNKGFILTVRKTPFVERRIGLIGAIDLEDYEFSNKSTALIRSTEGTIEERIPPRLKIRKNAKVEFPHIMVLFDDEKREITEKLYENRNSYKKLYDFDLNMGAGHVEGYFIDNYEEIIDKFQGLLSDERLIRKYQSKDKFLFAVGDGNHSLATAKAHWDNVKTSLNFQEREVHPARFALCEFNNIYDEGIYFEPIYRFVKNVDVEKFVGGIEKIDGEFEVITDSYKRVSKSKVMLPDSIRRVDEYVKKFISKNGGEVDYVHGEENLKSLIKDNENSLGITFKKLNKSDLFLYVSKNGSLPRKTFSMGEGIEKRYYLEGSRIQND